MVFAYRVYQLFRVFWIQNTLACVVGGVICFLMLALTQSSYLFYKVFQGSLDAYYIQILPSKNIALNPSAMKALVENIQPYLPEVQLTEHHDDQLTFEYLQILGASQDVAREEGLEIPSHLIVGKLKHRPEANFETRLDQVRKVVGVKAVDADLNFLEFTQQMVWVIPMAIGVVGSVMLLLLFYLVQFIVSGLMNARSEEMVLEYLLGATKWYQKAPYLGFACVVCVVSLGLACVAWGIWVYPNMTEVLNWAQKLGIDIKATLQSTQILSQGFLLTETWQRQHLGLLLLFVPAFLVGMALLFSMIWNIHFRWLILSDRNR